jgi:hypothetical protein
MPACVVGGFYGVVPASYRPGLNTDTNQANLVVMDSWRRQIASAFIPAVPLLILVPLCVE